METSERDPGSIAGFANEASGTGSDEEPVRGRSTVAGRRRSSGIGSRGYKSVFLAGLLSLLPGLGQVYVGYYQRGFVHAAIFATVITVLSSNAGPASLFGPMLAFFLIYNIIDATRRASIYNQVIDGVADVELPDDRLFKAGTRGSMLGGGVLVVLGLLLLLDTRWGVSLEWLEEWWPAGVILVGAYLFVQGFKARGEAA